MTPALRGSDGGSAAASFALVRRDLDHIREVCLAEGSRNGYFAAMYSRVTAAVERRARAGQFADADRMEAFVAAFARRYTEAYWAHAAGQATTRSWALAFEVADTSGPLVVQHLGLGMNAHINLDLGVVAAEVAVQESGSLAPVRPSRSLHDDFLAINDVLAELVERCQAAVVAASPLLGLADTVLATADEDLARFSLRIARSGAWQFACDLAGTPPSEWSGMIDRRDRNVADLGRRLLTRAGPADDVRRIVRMGEWRPVEDVIEALAAIDDS